MKINKATKKKLIFGIMTVVLLLLFLIGIKYALNSRNAYVPEDTVSAMDNERSQVYVSGKDYKLDVQTMEKHKEQQQKRSRILEEEEASHQQSSAKKRLSDTRGTPRRDDQAKTATPRPPQKSRTGRRAAPPPDDDDDDPDDPSDPDDPGKDEEDDDVPDKKNMKPTITTSIKDGQRTKGETVNFWVTVTDYKKQNVPVFSNGDGHFEVFVNGEKITSTGANGNKTNFRATVKDGKNKIKIVATDKRKKQGTKTLTIRCDTQAQNKIIGSVTVSASAPSLGIGTIFSGQKVDITEQEPLRDILSAAFKAQGITAEMSSSYLAGLKKSGIAKDAKITDELREKAEKHRVTLIEREDWPSGWQNRLREKEFCSHSGWTYRVNGDMPGVGIGSYVPDDGDDIDLVFSLFEGDMD